MPSIGEFIENFGWTEAIITLAVIILIMGVREWGLLKKWFKDKGNI